MAHVTCLNQLKLYLLWLNPVVKACLTTSVLQFAGCWLKAWPLPIAARHAGAQQDQEEFSKEERLVSHCECEGSHLKDVEDIFRT